MTITLIILAIIFLVGFVVLASIAFALLFAVRKGLAAISDKLGGMTYAMIHR